MSSASSTGTIKTIDGVSPVGGNVGLTSTGGTITITPGAGTINLEAVGGGGGGITTINGNVGSVAGAAVTLTGGTSGAVFTGAATTMTQSFNYLSLPDSTSSALGVIGIGGARFAHCFPGITDANAFFGNDAGNFALTGTSNTGVGSSVLTLLTTGTNNTIAGAEAASNMTSAQDNCGYGLNSLLNLATTNFNCAYGSHSLNNSTTGAFNIALGPYAGTNLTTTESHNIYLGSQGVLGESNVMRLGIGTVDQDPTTTYIGGIQGNTPSGSAEIVYIESNGLMSSTSALSIAELNLPQSTTPSSGVININSTLFLHNFGGTNDRNTFVGQESGTDAITSGNLTGDENTFLGAQTANNLLGSASGNTGIGTFSLYVLETGNFNTAVGHNSGSAYTAAETQNILLGYNTGVAGESGTMHLGDNGMITATYVGGVFGATVVGSAVLIDSTGLMGTVVSSERYKDNIEDLGDTDVLKLRPVSFSYKSNPAYEMQSGLIAEEVDKVMPRIVVRDKDGRPESVMYHELPVLLLNEIKKLSARVDELESRLAKSKK